MAPAGSWDSLQAAIQAKAGSIYFGMGTLNMRSHSAQNFSIDDLPEIMRVCKGAELKAYATLNSILYDEDLSQMKSLCHSVQENGVDAIIASDIAAISYARSIGLNVHISTQLNVCNLEAVRFFSRYADVIVLARELTLEQIRFIFTSIKKEDIRGPSGELVRIELFAHGALCISISGKCHMSLLEQNSSANRGKCTQNCRRKYRVIDEQTQNELVLDNQYIMSPTDLCTIEFLDQILDAGVAVLKIEGRGRPPEYVRTVVTAYREAVEAISARNYSEERKKYWKTQLSTVYNRGFWEGGYYLGKKFGQWSAGTGSQATQLKTQLGKVTNYFSNLGVVEVLLENGGLACGNKVLISGPTTGVVSCPVEKLHTDREVSSAEKGQLVSFSVPERVRKNDKLYLITDRLLSSAIPACQT